MAPRIDNCHACGAPLAGEVVANITYEGFAFSRLNNAIVRVHGRCMRLEFPGSAPMLPRVSDSEHDPDVLHPIDTFSAR